MRDSEDFARVTDQFRRELLAHCYRMLGSIHDAEDLVQETYLRAWRSYETYDGRRASLRTWLYRIATNACLTALEHRGRRPLPSGIGGPSADPAAPLVHRPELTWLEPIPDALLTAGGHDDPAAIVASRGSVRLALIAALQYLSPRQRAVLILRDVLAWRAAEVAGLLETTTAAVNSTLQRARAQLAQVAPAEDDLTEPGAADRRELVDRYAAAMEDADIPALLRLLREDAVLEMPPYLSWFVGHEGIRGFFAARLCGRQGALHAVPTSANDQPALGVYKRDHEGAFRAHSIQVFTVSGSQVTRVVVFQDPTLFAKFGLPQTHLAPVAHG